MCIKVQVWIGMKHCWVWAGCLGLLVQSSVSMTVACLRMQHWHYSLVTAATV